MDIFRLMAHVLFISCLLWTSRLSRATRLACQQEIRARPSGVVIVNRSPLPRVAGIRDVMPTHRSARLASSRADLCCGDRAFSSEVWTCCLGRLVRRGRRTCCLDGSTVPGDSTCACVPASGWIITELANIRELEEEYSDLVETASLRMTSLKQRKLVMEAEVERLDGLENQIYQSFLEEVGVDRDPNEADYIIQMVSFLNSNEANIEGARRGLRVLGEATRLLDSDVVEDEEVASTRRMRREIDALNTTIMTAESMAEVVRSELDTSLEEDERRLVIEEMIFERKRILLSIREEERSLKMLHDRVTILKRMISVLHSDYNLLVKIRSHLDQVLDEVFTMEESLKEEYRDIMEERLRGLSRKRRSATEDSFHESEIIIPRRGGSVPPHFLLQLPRRNAFQGAVMHPQVFLNSPTNENPDTITEKKESYPSSTFLPPTRAAVHPSSTTSRPLCNFTLWHQFIDSFAHRVDSISANLAEIPIVASQESQVNKLFTEHERIDHSDISRKNIVRNKRSVRGDVTRNDDATLRHKLRFYSEFTPYIWMRDFQNFQLSDSFISNLTELMKKKNLGVFSIL